MKHKSPYRVFSLMLIILLASCAKSTGTSSSGSSDRYRPTLSIPPYVEPEMPDMTEFKKITALRRFNATGFSERVTGGGVLEESNLAYAKISNAEQFFDAALNHNIRVMEIVADIEMGYEKIGNKYYNSNTSIIKRSNPPLMHPDLKETGVTRFIFNGRQDLTIFSKNGAKILHGGWDFRDCHNIMIRNLEFDEMWEWDEATRGDYDVNDWDFLTYDYNNTRMWVDHCTFTNAYDGVIDVKQGPNELTVSYIKTREIEYGPGTFIARQMDYLEEKYQAAKAAKTIDLSIQRYTVFRNLGMSKEQIAKFTAPTKKVHLLGANENIANYRFINVTFHHNLYQHVQDRLPRLRTGNVNIYNIVADGSLTLEARRECDGFYGDFQGYKICPTSQGSISVEDGAMEITHSFYRDINSIIRNNQKDETDNYTGKILVNDSVYRTTVYDQGEPIDYYFRGSSDDTSSPFAPYNSYGALEKEFSWNGGTWEGVTWTEQLPFATTGTVDTDVDHLVEILTSPFTGAGSGVLNWHPKFWLVSNYLTGVE